MTDRREWRKPSPVAIALAAAALILMASACKSTGDLGRPQRAMLFAADPMASWPGDELPPAQGSSLGLTADEVQLRDAAVSLRLPTDDLGPGGGLDPNRDYADRLTRARFAFGPSRLARIDQDIAADHDALTRFGRLARRVAFADHERRRALGSARLRASWRDRGDARSRIEENRAFMLGTLADLERRIDAYRTAVDRTRIETPAVSPVAAMASLVHLHERTTSLRYELKQIYAHSAAESSQDPTKIPPNVDGAPLHLSPRRHRK